MCQGLSAAPAALPEDALLCNSVKILLSPCSGMAGMRKWLLILVQGWRNLPGGSRAEEAPELRMLSHHSLFVFLTGAMGAYSSPVLGSRDKLLCVTFAILGWEQ